ncbi:hypothetical protein [Cupriavidus alkaliphilus]|uniref:Translation initiation factor IF-2 n=1 Tax=Cupriavidus alkaliphilus TaxID=942866 RepID=A0A1C3UBG9_9BURK|nr:hypothetical protein [Cupriavidus alkaliphilus]MBB2918864.1 hypothetical protein [Cupriavidus alkaliphilus]MBB3008665.1 hypothetical protein [Cupriavidus alkaliphilus]MBB3013661.1 hypothetical protein [Cupriavidus alkaliphilus]RAS12254.1 hypothetical protein C7415_101288 [Cupriavidus alkaliphilus]SCB12803.1 hypothetical protein GA0116996_102342 [Cupriavidus alkaliphilus]
MRSTIPHAAALVLLSAFAGAALAQPADTGVRTDKGPKGSQTIPPPGASTTPGSTPGATPTNPGGLAKDLGDVPKEPHTAGGLPGRDKPKPASESAGKADRDGLHGKPRTGSGGASIDQTRVPDAKGR